MSALALTAAGRRAVADAAHVGTESVEITHLALGDGLRPAGADDDARTALRSERERQPVAGRVAAAGHVAAVADWTPTATYAATEVGVVATVDSAAVLLAYGAAESASEAWTRATAGTRLVVALDVAVTSAAADLAVTLSPSVRFETVPAATTAAAGKARRATGAEAAAAAAATVEADRAALAADPYVSPREAARIPIAVYSALRGAAPAGRRTLDELYDHLVGGAAADRNTLGKIATALAELARRSNVKALFQIYVPPRAAADAPFVWNYGAPGGSLLGVAAANGVGITVPAGTWLFEPWPAQATGDERGGRLRVASAQAGSWIYQHRPWIETLAAPRTYAGAITAPYPHLSAASFDAYLVKLA